MRALSHNTTRPQIAGALLNWNVWGRLALDDLWLRYRRTVLGPLWITLSQGVWVFGIYSARQAFGGGDDANYSLYLQYLTLGILLYNFIANALVDGPNVLQRSAGLILSYPISASLFVIRGIAGAFISFVHALPVFVIVGVLTGYTPTFGVLAAIPGLLALLLFVTGLYFFFGALGARFRDIGPATTSFSALLFILTPIMWMPAPAQEASWLVHYNPIHYLVEAVRQPILGLPFDLNILIVAFCLGMVSAMTGLFVYVWQEKDIAYWL